MNIVTVTPPEVEPVGVDEALDHLNLTSRDDAPYVETVIKAARRLTEEQLGRALITQTLRYELDAFPCGGLIRLPRPRVQGLTELAYTDTAGDPQTLAASAYQLDTVSEPARLAPAPNTTWPSTQAVFGAVRVTYATGYGDEATDVPDDILHAIKIRIADLFAHRESQVVGTIVTQNNKAIQALLSPYRVRWRP